MNEWNFYGLILDGSTLTISLTGQNNFDYENGVLTSRIDLRKDERNILASINQRIAENNLTVETV